MQMMTVMEVAEFLRLKAPTVCRLAAEGKLPGVKIGKCWRFEQSALEMMIANAQSDIID